MGDISYRTVDRGAPYAADQALVYCRRLFRWALDRDIYGLTGSPVAGISSKDHGVEKKPRTHILSDDDLRLLPSEEARQHVNATDVLGGTYTPHCAAIHPARLVRGLGRAAKARWMRRLARQAGAHAACCACRQHQPLGGPVHRDRPRRQSRPG